MSEPVQTRKLHPYIERFIATDESMVEMISKAGLENDPVVQALQRVYTAITTPDKWAETLEWISQLSLEGADPDICIIIFYYWMHLAEKLGREMEMIAVQRRARATLQPTTPALLRGIVDVMEADIAIELGNRPTAERLLRGVCETVPRSLPRYKIFLWFRCNVLCHEGRGRDVERELEWLKTQCTANFPVSRYGYSVLVNGIATGRLNELKQWADVCEQDGLLNALDRENYQRWKLWLELYNGAWTQGPLRGPLPEDETSAVAAAAWSTYALQQRNTELALQWARHSVRKNLVIINSVYLDAYALIRAELASGNTASARYLLELRRKRGNVNFFDDFFLARVEWQNGNREKAAAHFATLLRAVEHYGAEGRLDFELRLAPDLSAADAMQLMRLAERHGHERNAAAAVEAAIAPAAAATANADGSLLGASPALAAVRASIAKFAVLPVPVLITGETGTGKDLVARALHESSDRKSGPFIAVNCGAISETLLESELFGHVRGAFTGAERERAGVFQEAGAGTLFLDEIGEISPRLQVALLRVLESNEIRPVGSSKSRKVSCRVIFATNVDLEKAVEAGSFRRDLLYRLKRLQIQLQPLRERREDIVLLATHFLNLGHSGNTPVQLTPELSVRLKTYHWPGNVRELRNEMERMRLLTSDKGRYGLEDLAENIFRANPRISGDKQAAVGAPASSAPGLTKPQTGVVTIDAPPGTGVGTSITRFLEKGRSPLRRMDRLRELFQRHKKMTRAEIAHILKISPNTATRDLKDLCDEGFILKVEPTPAPVTHYFQLNEQPK